LDALRVRALRAQVILALLKRRTARWAPSPSFALGAFSSLYKKEKIRQKSQKKKIRENYLSFSYSSTAIGDLNVS
jgi:hypothetical protein